MARDVWRGDHIPDPFYMRGLDDYSDDVPARRSSPSGPAGACPIVAPNFEPNRGEAAAPAMLTLLPGKTFPVAALGSEWGEWLGACLPTMSTTLGEPCTVLCQARARDKHPSSQAIRGPRHALCAFSGGG